MFGRGNEVPERVSQITKRELFSVCGKFTGWLRIACSYINRKACRTCTGWEDGVDVSVVDMLNDELHCVREDDPV